MDKEKPNIASLILAFSSQALRAMGYLHPDQEQKDINLDLARYNIEVIELLQEKTAGNLDDDEKKLMTDLLTDLKLKYSKIPPQT